MRPTVTSIQEQRTGSQVVRSASSASGGPPGSLLPARRGGAPMVPSAPGRTPAREHRTHRKLSMVSACGGRSLACPPRHHATAAAPPSSSFVLASLRALHFDLDATWRLSNRRGGQAERRLSHSSLAGALAACPLRAPWIGSGGSLRAATVTSPGRVPWSGAVCCALGATRTRDLLLRRQLLYPLSYQGSSGGSDSAFDLRFPRFLPTWRRLAHRYWSGKPYSPQPWPRPG
jgi:hypothetical protein